LVKHKLLEEKTDSVLKVFPCFLADIKSRGVAFKPSFESSFNPAYIGYTSPVDKMMLWVENKVLGLETAIDKDQWYIHRELVASFAKHPESLNEDWYEINYDGELQIRPIKLTEGNWSRSSNTIKLAEGIDGSKTQNSILKTIQEKHEEAMEVIMKMLLAQ
jgi:hypothetical protein